ncbi:M16 family metallopeptidase [Falsihalocynthiibacter sp. SS001]|uniref:M16 family metallopeptidase n=1 Tax=Falsihalocynthiibacter sp. SS001 TaxID=3349698 RepID=UPI0036D2328F
MKSFLTSLFLTLSLASPLRAEVDIQEVTSPNGVTAWLVEEHSIPFTAIEIWFRGGARLDAEGKRGASYLMTGLLEEGAGELDAQGFAEAAEELATSFSYNVYDDTLTVSAQFLTENRDEAVALLRSSLIEPRFDEDAVERVRGQVESIIRSDAKTPNTIASKKLNELAWGDHPYATSISGTLESVAALTRDDLIEAKDRVLTLDRVYVGAVGDITPDALGELVDELLAGLPETGPDLPAEAVYGLPKGGETVVEFETPQSVALFAHEGIKRDDPDFFPAYVLNQVLGGGGFASILMEEVREKRGLTYGVSSFLAPRDQGALIMGQVASANDRIAEAIEVIREVWADVAENGVAEQQLEDAKTFLTGAYPLRFDGNANIAGIMVGMQAEDLPIDYIATRNDKVNAVTMDDIKRVAERLLRPEDLHFVIVGKPEGLEKSE